jgi:hypothetical protein
MKLLALFEKAETGLVMTNDESVIFVKYWAGRDLCPREARKFATPTETFAGFNDF